MDAPFRQSRGEPIVVVSGLPRSGTSMMMRMLEAGGVPILGDGERTPDIDNPKGYFELERIKDLEKETDKSYELAAQPTLDHLAQDPTQLDLEPLPERNPLESAKFSAMNGWRSAAVLLRPKAQI